MDRESWIRHQAKRLDDLQWEADCLELQLERTYEKMARIEEETFEDHQREAAFNRYKAARDDAI